MTILAAVLTLALAWQGEEHPFTDLDYEAALAKAGAEQRLLFVDFTADWCPPCKQMDRDTWRAPEVMEWLAANALALQVDVDDEPELARRFAIRAMPTVAVMRAGEELDRAVGYKNAEDFLAWANDVLAGRTSRDALEERARELADSYDVKARYELARELGRAGKHDEALEHYLWLWPATRGTSLSGVRVSFMLSDVARIAGSHEPTRQAFMKILEETQQRVEAALVPASDDWREWRSLCKYLGQGERLLEWYETRRDDQGRLLADSDEFVVGLIVDDVGEALMDAERYLEAVRLYPDARARARDIVNHYERSTALNEGLREEHRAQTEAFQRGKLRTDLARLFAALLAAGREEEADAAAALLLETLDEPESREALVRRGLEVVGRADPRFGPWLDEAEAAGENVRTLRKRLARLAEGGETEQE